MKRNSFFNSLLTALIPLSYLPPIILSLNALPIETAQITSTSYIGLFTLFIGLILWAVSLVWLGHSFQVTPQASQLVTTGPYRFFRHPIYLGIILTMLGLSLATKSMPALIYTLYFLIPLSMVRIHYEDKALAQKFKQTYSKYRNSTML